jgi:hypothetical protein
MDGYLQLPMTSACAGSQSCVLQQTRTTTDLCRLRLQRPSNMQCCLSKRSHHNNAKMRQAPYERRIRWHDVSFDDSSPYVLWR